MHHMQPQPEYRFIISGGGTGGHIFPALAIADELRKRYPTAQFLFVGAENRMEMEKVPMAGYEIRGIPVTGIDRQNWGRNLYFPFKLWKSIKMCRGIIKKFDPHIAIGTGGFASGPTLYLAQRQGIPTVVQEQNSYPGLTNRILSKKAKALCVAYDGLETYFPKGKIHFTGNPVRTGLGNSALSPSEARLQLGLDTNKKTLLVLGGSQGAGRINDELQEGFRKIIAAGHQVLWQCGRGYYDQLKVEIGNVPGLILTDFLPRMDLAYASANCIVSRAGAGTISELCLVGKPVILVPSPNVANDHQTKNARNLEKNSAALLIRESEIENLIPQALALFSDSEKQATLAGNIVKLAKPNATAEIVDIIEKYLPQ